MNMTTEKKQSVIYTKEISIKRNAKQNNAVNYYLNLSLKGKKNRKYINLGKHLFRKKKLGDRNSVHFTLKSLPTREFRADKHI